MTINYIPLYDIKSEFCRQGVYAEVLSPLLTAGSIFNLFFQPGIKYWNMRKTPLKANKTALVT